LIGFGTSQLRDCGTVVAHALKLGGYRYAANILRRRVEAFACQCRTPRNFVTTKVSRDQAPPILRVGRKLRKLRLNYVDLPYIGRR
jgi:hypothetical protein